MINLEIKIKGEELKRKLNIKDGKDGESIIGPAGKDGANGSPDTAIQIVEKLESIDNESEKLSIEAIKDLKKELERIEKKIGVRPLFGGGFSVNSMNFHIIDDESPTNTGDDLNFTISHAPSPISSLKVYRNGARQKLTEDYTFSGVTITLINALQAGEILLCDYRV